MPQITLPDGSKRQYANPVTVAEVAADIGAGLAKAAVAGKLDGQLVDTSHVVDQDACLQIITAKDSEGLEIIRHSTAHLLAHAVKQLFPSAQVTIGPTIEHGFYYDFAFERPFTPEDLVQIEEKMRELIRADIPIERQVVSREEALQLFRSLGEFYKAEIIADIPEGETITLYWQADFVDLCRGPHVPRTGFLKVFKLMNVAGAYWRGDAKNEMLQRIYGTAWADKKALQAYLDRLAEAEKRDHRRLAKAMDLFHLQEEAPGMVFWHPNGWTLYQVIQRYLRCVLETHGYQEVWTPMMADRSLWEKSGHWEKFQEAMFITESENRHFAIKPMNCPGHVQIFNQGLKSYRDLPLRLAEFGSCHRNEPSGALHGLMRVRHFVQDDAHIFCTEDQIGSEANAFIDLLFKVYEDFGFKEIIVKLATRPAVRVGSDAMWDRAEAALMQALDSKQLTWTLSPGEGAFYGPKIEFTLQDCLGRAWQCGTVQLDFSTPERLGAYYIAEDNTKKVPVMLHRAIFGSLERFIGILLEHYAGKLPLWLAPKQVVVMTITEQQNDYAQSVFEKLQQAHLRASIDLRNEKIGFKIRQHTLAKVPYQLIIGEREKETVTVSVRTLEGDSLGSQSLDELLSHLSVAAAMPR